MDEAVQTRAVQIHQFLWDNKHRKERTDVVLSAAFHGLKIPLYEFDNPSDMPDDLREQLGSLMNTAFVKVAQAEADTGTQYPDEILVTAVVDTIELLAKQRMPDDFRVNTGTLRQ